MSEETPVTGGGDGEPRGPRGESEGSRSRLSLWEARAGPASPEGPLDHDEQVDVAIVGAGFTGLWTAYYLRKEDPSLRVVVVEKEHVGYGASGRNGGWCSSHFPVSSRRLQAEEGTAAATRLEAVMRDTVAEVGRVCAAESIEADYARDGMLVLARNAPQVERLRDDIAQARSLGAGEEDLRWLEPGEVGDMLRVSNCLGATFTPHCAALDPLALVRGLAAATRARGARIFEGSPALAISPGRVVTPGGQLRAEVVVRATEAYTASLAGLKRHLLPVYSLMIATAPLAPSAWEGIGWERRFTLTDGRHSIIYGQRTADGRIAFGGRGAPYHFASRILPAFDHEGAVFDQLAKDLGDLLARPGELPVAHCWGGPLGVPRDWHPSVTFDRASGLAWAGGYIGNGVASSNLAGRTLSSLVRGAADDLTELPWVGHRPPPWEPEPLRWMAVTAATRSMSLADRHEDRTGRPSRLAARLAHLVGG